MLVNFVVWVFSWVCSFLFFQVPCWSFDSVITDRCCRYDSSPLSCRPSLELRSYGSVLCLCCCCVCDVFMHLWDLCSASWFLSPFPSVCEFSCSVVFLWFYDGRTDCSSNCDSWHSPYCQLQKTLHPSPCPFCKVGTVLSWRTLFICWDFVLFLEPVLVTSSKEKYGVSNMKSSRENTVYRFREKDKLRTFSKDKQVAAYQSNTSSTKLYIIPLITIHIY